jgi:RHS repeat-associated protein
VSRSHAIGSNAFDRAYAYDDLDRLASDGGVTYTYDAAGNRTTRTENGITTTYTLGVGDRLAAWTGGSYAYDFAGNVTRIERDGRPTLDLTWNSQYQLVSVATNGVFAEGYAYDALSRRVSTTTLEGTTRHVYDDNWQVIADINEDGSVVASYTWGDGIDRLLAVTIGGVTYYALTDIQGTVWGYVDSQNNVVARFMYDAWGNVLSEEIDPSAAALASLRYRFQGREWSAATGLINFRMRWYDAEMGRWLSKDPIGLSGGLNLYAFCENNVLIVTDPQGCVGLAGLGAGIAAAGAVAWVGYKIWNRAKCADDEMKCRDSRDLRDVVDGAINVIKGLLGDIASPFGIFPDATSPITDKLGGALVKPIVDQLPLPSPSPKRPSGDEQIRPLP